MICIITRDGSMVKITFMLYSAIRINDFPGKRQFKLTVVVISDWELFDGSRLISVYKQFFFLEWLVRFKSVTLLSCIGQKDQWLSYIRRNSFLFVGLSCRSGMTTFYRNILHCFLFQSLLKVNKTRAPAAKTILHTVKGEVLIWVQV